MNDTAIGRCWHCGRPLFKSEFGRETTCLGCAKPTRVCRNCRHFSPTHTNECDEPMVERLLNKEQANFCEWFEPDDAPATLADNPSAEQLRQAAEDLFR